MADLEVLELRPWLDSDLPLMERTMGDARMTEHLGGPESPEKLRDRLHKYVRSGVTDNTHMFVVTLGPQKIPVGSVGYWEKTWQGREGWETGWHVLLEYQGRGIATRATAMVIERSRAEGLHRFMHAYPSVDNAASNAICRKLGFTLMGETDFEFPPGRQMRCHDWRLDLDAAGPKISPNDSA